MKIEPMRMLDQIRAKIGVTSHPRHRAMLANMLEHCSAELDGRSVSRIMDTMVSEPNFQWFGFGVGDVGPKGRAAVEAHYAKMLGEGYNLHEHQFEKFMVDDHYIVLDGPIHIVFPGRVLKNMGQAIEDADAFYLFSARSWAIFHFDDEGRCTGEDSFSDGAVDLARLKKLRPDEIPAPIRV